MTNDPDAIRRDIERTRANLSEDVNALAYEANPKNVVRRKTDEVTGKVTGTASSLKDKVMGTAHDTTSTVSDKGHSAKSTVTDAASSVGDAAAATPQKVVSQTQGNPLAAGLVAFGVGMVVAALLPVSEKERTAAQEIKDKAVTPLKEEVTSVAKDAAAHLKEPAQDAAASLKETATQAATTVKEEGTSAAQDVQLDAQQAKETVQQSRGT